jgi:hypothetical protein
MELPGENKGSQLCFLGHTLRVLVFLYPILMVHISVSAQIAESPPSPPKSHQCVESNESARADLTGSSIIDNQTNGYLSTPHMLSGSWRI